MGGGERAEVTPSEPGRRRRRRRARTVGLGAQHQRSTTGTPLGRRQRSQRRPHRVAHRQRLNIRGGKVAPALSRAPTKPTEAESDVGGSSGAASGRIRCSIGGGESEARIVRNARRRRRWGRSHRDRRSGGRSRWRRGGAAVARSAPLITATSARGAAALPTGATSSRRDRLPMARQLPKVQEAPAIRVYHLN